MSIISEINAVIVLGNVLDRAGASAAKLPDPSKLSTLATSASAFTGAMKGVSAAGGSVPPAASVPSVSAPSSSAPTTYTAQTGTSGGGGEAIGGSAGSVTGQGTADDPTGFKTAGGHYADLVATRQHKTFTTDQSALINTMSQDPYFSLDRMNAALLIYDEIYFSVPPLEAPQKVALMQQLNGGQGSYGGYLKFLYPRFDIGWLAPDIRWIQQQQGGGSKAAATPPAAHPASTPGGAAAAASGGGGGNVARGKIVLGGGSLPMPAAAPTATSAGVTGGPDILLAPKPGAPDVLTLETPALADAVRRLEAMLLSLQNGGKEAGKAPSAPTGTAGPTMSKPVPGVSLSNAFFRGAVP